MFLMKRYLEWLKGKRSHPYQDTATVTAPVSSQVFSSWLNMVGCTVRDALALTIGRALSAGKATESATKQ